MCTCTIPYTTLQGNACVCNVISYTTLSGSNCICTIQNTAIINNQCQCTISNSYLSGTQCVCTDPNAVVSEGQCKAVYPTCQSKYRYVYCASPPKCCVYFADMYGNPGYMCLPEARIYVMHQNDNNLCYKA
ncbi:Hypothetical_protein [Hexamita inflata]|uniref:Hypothetical_protein n=1 Tax=Hexamita inflata TaxID=28002 RepID=A0AA86QXI1_9EUKA|nr:Hypothetical protein HINF_LOCUS53608 [Hexamita inflata]